MNAQFRIAEALAEIGATTYVVGGYVRDLILGKESKDVDLEVYSVEPAIVLDELRKFPFVDHAEIHGKAFSTILVTTLDGQHIDVNFPRRENKVGKGHAGFSVEIDPYMSIEDATGRRDFTINGIMQDALDQTKYYDRCSGVADLQGGILRHIGPAFAEDPLRVFRGMQFAARFDMQLWPDTAHLCQKMFPTLSELSKERVYQEFWKLCVRGEKPSRGLQFLRESGAIKMFPELVSLIGCPQSEKHHPEGDVWVHTCMVADAMVITLKKENELSEEDRFVLVMSAICHDFGKPCTTVLQEDGRITSYGHDAEAEPLVRSFMERIGCPEKYIARVLKLVTSHMATIAYNKKGPSSRNIRRLAKRLWDKKDAHRETIYRLVLLCVADSMGTGSNPGYAAEMSVASKAHEMEYYHGVPDAIVPYLTGKDLIDAGLKPGPQFAKILGEAQQLQDDEEIKSRDMALQWFRNRIK